MRGIPQHVIVILLLGFVLLAPLFEIFDQSQDIEQGTDFVLVLLCAFVSIGLFILCKTFVCVLVHLLLIATVPADAFILLRNRSLEVEISPPKSLVLLGSLRV